MAAAAPEVEAEMLVVVVKTGGRVGYVGKELEAAYTILHIFKSTTKLISGPEKC